MDVCGLYYIGQKYAFLQLLNSMTAARTLNRTLQTHIATV